MCGRISLFAELGDLASQFRFALTPAVDGYQPSWNVAPTARILVVTADAGERVAGLMRWGFIFSGPGSRRFVSAAAVQRPGRNGGGAAGFRVAYAKRRCLIPANGFYEWQTGGGGKTPMWIHRTDEQPFALARHLQRQAGRGRVGHHQRAQLVDGVHSSPDAGASGRRRP